jgi:hypothetical protein
MGGTHGKGYLFGYRQRTKVRKCPPVWICKSAPAARVHRSTLGGNLFLYFFHYFLSSQKVTKKDLTKRTLSACGFAQTAFCLNGKSGLTLRSRTATFFVPRPTLARCVPRTKGFTHDNPNSIPSGLLKLIFPIVFSYPLFPALLFPSAH